MRVEHVERPVYRTDRAGFLHDADRAGRHDVPHQDQPGHRVQRVIARQARPAANRCTVVGVLRLTEPDFEIVADECGGIGRHCGGVIGGRAGPIARRVGRADRGAFALCRKQPERGERNISAGRDLASDLRHAATLSDDPGGKLDFLTDRRDKPDLRGPQGGKIGKCAACGGEGNDCRSPTVKRSSLHPFICVFEADRTGLPRYRIEQAGYRHPVPVAQASRPVQRFSGRRHWRSDFRPFIRADGQSRIANLAVLR